MTVLTYAHAMLAGMETLARMALGGEVAPWMLWTAIRGAERYTAALAAGAPESTEAVKVERYAACAACPHRTARSVFSAGTAYYCGTPFVEDSASRTCGCLVALNVSAAGKPLLADERCPQGRWP